MSLLIRILDKSYWGLLWVETHPYLSCMEIRPVVFVQSCWQTNQSANGHEKHNLLCEGNDRLFCSSVLDIMPSLRSLSNKICNEKGSLADALLKVFIIIQLQEVSINGAHFKCIKCIISGLQYRKWAISLILKSVCTDSVSHRTAVCLIRMRFKSQPGH